MAKSRSLFEEREEAAAISVCHYGRECSDGWIVKDKQFCPAENFCTLKEVFSFYSIVQVAAPQAAVSAEQFPSAEDLLLGG